MSPALKNRGLGVVFLALLLAGLYGVYGVFTQKFTDFADVTLKTDQAGLSLPDRADVKVRGEIIGEVRTLASNGHGAILTLGLQPDKIGLIPDNVTAALLPKTLFGEKYVSLEIPNSPSSTPLKAGDTITQTKLPIEVEKVLDDIYPLLRTVQPAELNYTLNALSTALEGRGAEIGKNITVLANYLRRFNPQVPALMNDLRELSTVSATYADVMPQIAATLRNSVKTMGTLEAKHVKLNHFLKDVTAFSNTARDFLDANGQNIIKLGQLSAPQLKLLARYSPEFPCLLGGIVNAIPQAASTFRGFVFHIDLYTLKKQPRGYNANEVPVYGANNPPHCGALPNPPWSATNHFRNTPDFNDGAPMNLKRVAPGSYASRSAYMPTPVTGTEQEKAVVVSLLAPAMNVPADRVPDLATLLFGPLVRGSEVSAR